MLEAPHIVETDRVETAVIRLTVPRAEIQRVMGPGRAELMAALETQGIAPAGPWLSHHFRMAPDVFDFEIAIPVARPITPMGRVTPGSLPATTAARTVYRGPYEGLGAAWGEFGAWIAAQGRKAAPSLWEVYVSDGSGPGGDGEPRVEFTRPLLG